MSENRSSTLTQYERISLMAFRKPYAEFYSYKKQILNNVGFLA